jgi:lipid-binding SYLF domain-containing protein
MMNSERAAIASTRTESLRHGPLDEEAAGVTRRLVMAGLIATAVLGTTVRPAEAASDDEEAAELVSGVFVARDQTNRWAGPAFYTIGQASFGFQAGGDVSELILLSLTERGVTALLETTVKLGGDVSVALGPVGAGVTGATAALSADLVSFSRAKGLYGGISVDGAVIAVRKKLDEAYYDGPVTPTDILITRKVSNPLAAPLLAAVRAAAV